MELEVSMPISVGNGREREGCTVSSTVRTDLFASSYSPRRPFNGLGFL